MNKQRKHSFTSFLSFFWISAEETVSSRWKKPWEKKTMFFSALEETGEPWEVPLFVYYIRFFYQKKNKQTNSWTEK